jgi:hypothetical protein
MGVRQKSFFVASIENGELSSLFGRDESPYYPGS